MYVWCGRPLPKVVDFYLDGIVILWKLNPMTAECMGPLGR